MHVSIRAPRVRGRLVGILGVMRRVVFQSAPPVRGGDQMLGIGDAGVDGFQSAPPVARGRRGADVRRRHSACSFNPRPP